MSTVAPTIRKHERKYKKPRILCLNGCGQMVSVRLNGTPHGHICEKADNGNILNSVAADVNTEKCEAADAADDIAGKTVPSSPTSKKNTDSVLDAMTAHPKMKLKQQLMTIDVGDFAES